VTPEYVKAGIPHSLQLHEVPEGAVVYRIHGPFLFGATDKLSIVDDELPELPKVVILRLRNMTAIDATGLHALEALADRLHASGRHLLLCGIRDQPAKMMSASGFHAHIGDANITKSLEGAVARARELLGTG
jgi:SulP family sulfate permease